MTASALDQIMLVMGEAFDPAFGEAWTRRQISDALARTNTFCLIGHAPGTEGEAHGFALSRQVVDEEELLLIAVRPAWRGQGVGWRLLTELRDTAIERGTKRLFLEMRDGNPARAIYEKFGFGLIGRRPGYYRSAADGPIDALTFALTI
jgi:ribosomal-protein-alanine N-acetyltransferase